MPAGGGLHDLNEFLHRVGARADSRGVAPTRMCELRPVQTTITQRRDIKVDFRGHLRLPDDAGTGIPVLLRLDDIFVVISSGGDELGAWRADDVVIERIYSNQFAIELDGEPMVFVAQDALGFAYEGISAIEGVQERLTKRRVFRRSKKKEKAVGVEQEPTEPAVAEPAGTQDAPVPPPSAPPVPTVEETTPEPVAADDAEEPIMWGQPGAIWTPPSADTPSPRTPTAPSEPQPDFDLAVPEPIERRFESEDADARGPEDVRVSYPQPERPPAPAVETFVPPAEPDEPAVEAREPVSPAPVPRDEPAVEAGESVSPAPGSRAEHTPAEVEPAVETPEYEIEEVAPAASGVSWQADDESYLEEEEPAAEFEIEDYVLPSAGAIETFNPPGVDADPEPAVDAPPEPTEVEAAPDTSEVAETDDAAESQETAVPSDPEPPTEAAETDVAAASNGHRDELETDTSKRERRHSLFGRSRDKKIPPHEHRYGDPKTIGGLTRQVCEVCGHVTFSGEDVYQGW